MRPKERPSRRLREQMPTQVTAHIATVVEQIPADVELSAMVKMFAVSDTRKHYTTNRDTLDPDTYYCLPVGHWERHDRTNRQRWRALALETGSI